MNENYNVILELILTSRHIKSYKNIEKNKIEEIVATLNKCNIYDFSEIQKIGAGTYSTVYKIKNKVIKIGLAKASTEIIVNPRIVHCFLRSNIAVETQNMKMIIGVEIQEVVDMQDEKEICELFEVYEELRKEKLIWTDVKSSNVGYKDGKLVVIDTDSIYHENDTKIIWFTSIAKDFEEKYKKEKI